MRPGRGADHPSPSSAKVKERIMPYLTLPLWDFMVCSRMIFTFTFTQQIILRNLRRILWSCVRTEEDNVIQYHTGWRTKCHTTDCARNTFLLLQNHLTPSTELILIGWKIVPNEEHVQCYHRFASQTLTNELLHSSQLFDTSLQKARGTISLCGPRAF